MRVLNRVGNLYFGASARTENNSSQFEPITARKELKADEFNRNENAENNTATEPDLKTQRDAKNKFHKEQKKEAVRQRAIAVGLNPENLDYNQLLKYERAIKVGLNPEISSYKDIEYLENRNNLLDKARILKIDLPSSGIDTSNKIELDNLIDVVDKAETALSDKITCLGLGLPEDATAEETHEIFKGWEEAENQRLNEKLSDYANSGNIEDLAPKKGEEKYLSLSDFRSKCSIIYDAVMDEKISIDSVEDVIKIYGKKSPEEIEKILNNSF